MELESYLNEGKMNGGVVQGKERCLLSQLPPFESGTGHRLFCQW